MKTDVVIYNGQNYLFNSDFTVEFINGTDLHANYNVFHKNNYVGTLKKEFNYVNGKLNTRSSFKDLQLDKFAKIDFTIEVYLKSPELKQNKRDYSIKTLYRG